MATLSAIRLALPMGVPSASTAGSTVVTSILKGAKSSATLFQMDWMFASSASLNVSGSPSKS